MGLFLSTTINRIDAKGRVSVPGAFRAALGDQPFSGIVLMKSPIHAALEGFAPATMEDMAARLDELPMFSAQQDDLAASTMAQSFALNFDGEGRIVLPAELSAYANFKNDVAFVGLGRKFQMWEPGAWDKRRIEAQASVRDKGLNLPKAPGGGA